MPFVDKGGTEDVETLVDKLAMDGNNLNEANLATLSTSDIQQLAELSQELHLETDMETEESEVIIENETDDDLLQTDIGAHEVEIETERGPSPEEILPDIKTTTITTTKTSVVPPLRPLTIAPKPAKMPIAVKPLPGQQLLLLQGASSSSGIKLVTTQGQELNLASLGMGRPMTLKPTVMKKLVTTTQKPVQAKPIKASGGGGGGGTTFITNKQGHLVMVQKASVPSSPQQQQAISNIATLPGGVKSLTFQQAQQMGILSTSKVISQAASTPKQQTLLLNKPQGSAATTTTTKTIKLVPQITPTQLVTTSGQKTVTLKSPTKILPATPTGTAAAQKTAPQRVIFKSATGGLASQIIQVTGSPNLNTGQLHQINIPGKGMQYIKFVAATSAEAVPTASIVKTTTALPSTPTNIVLSEVKPTSIAPKPLKTIAVKTPVSGQQVVMLPTYVPSQISSAKVPIPMRHTPVQAAKQQVVSPPEVVVPTSSADAGLDSNGMRPRKPCNCTKSQCLKLYCDCFANGEFCYLCNCMNCFNNLENEDHRQRAIKTCLERNPSAFRPKIGKAKDMSGDSSIRKHTKGCNCKRSGCLKNYCECYEAKIACSNNCKCVGCRNIEDSMEKRGMRTIHEDPAVLFPHHIPISKLAPVRDLTPIKPRRSSNTKQPINFITDDVIEATSQCLLTISDQAESNMQDVELTKMEIIEEFGRCLTEIINCSSTSTTGGGSN